MNTNAAALMRLVIPKQKIKRMKSGGKYTTSQTRNAMDAKRKARK